jgi:hypothetical protein
MKKKIIQLLFLLIPLLCNAQEYIDLFSVNYSKSQKTTFENSSINTSISTFQTNLTLPVVLDEKYTIVTGVNFSSYNLQLFPDSDNNSLYSTTIRAGLRVSQSEHWSGIYLLLPKVASDYKHLSTEDFYLGGLALLKYKRNKDFGYSFGLYASSEAFGLTMTPVIGLYYHSHNARFETTLLLPDNGDLNYSLTDKTKIGFDFQGHGNSYKLTTDDLRSTYAENRSIDFSSYVQRSFISNKILLRLKMGYYLNQFNIYPIDQKLDLQILILRFGNNRTRLLENSSSNLFFKMEAIYRFDLSTAKN